MGPRIERHHWRWGDSPGSIAMEQRRNNLTRDFASPIGIRPELEALNILCLYFKQHLGVQENTRVMCTRECAPHSGLLVAIRSRSADRSDARIC